MLIKVVQAFRSVGSSGERRDYEGSPELGAIPQQGFSGAAECLMGLTSRGKVRLLVTFKVFLMITDLHWTGSSCARVVTRDPRLYDPGLCLHFRKLNWYFHSSI